MEQITGRKIIEDAGLFKGYYDTVTNEAEGYKVYEAYTNTPEEDGNQYLGRFTTVRDAEYEVIRAYARDRNVY